jgi:hypothetical protein
VDERLRAFPTEASRHYAFLVDRFGFAGPDTSAEGFVSYAARPWHVSIGLHQRGGIVDTAIQYEDGEYTYNLPLDTYLMAKRLPLQWAANSAQTVKGVAKSLSRQSQTLAQLLPEILSGGRAVVIAAGAVRSKPIAQHSGAHPENGP